MGEFGGQSIMLVIASTMNVPALPSPPTDNLYKFMALSGVILLIIAPFFWAKFYITHTERTRSAWDALRPLPYEYFMAKAKVESGEPVSEGQRKLVETHDAMRKESDKLGSEYLLYDRFSNVVTATAVFLWLLGHLLTWFGFL